MFDLDIFDLLDSKFQVKPLEKLMFNSNQIGTSTVITLTNNSPSVYAFKVSF